MVLFNTGGNKELPTYAISDGGKVLEVTINSNGGTPVAETVWASRFEGYEYKGESFVLSQTAIATNQTVTYHLALNTEGGDDYDFMIFCVPESGISMSTYYGMGSEANLIIKNCGPEVPQYEYLAWIYIFRKPKQGSTHNVFVIGSASNDCVRAPELPTLGTAGQVLSVNSGATGVEWDSLAETTITDKSTYYEIETGVSGSGGGGGGSSGISAHTYSTYGEFLTSLIANKGYIEYIGDSEVDAFVGSIYNSLGNTLIFFQKINANAFQQGSLVLTNTSDTAVSKTVTLTGISFSTSQGTFSSSSQSIAVKIENITHYY